ncbi:MAG TPA: hypothetical protein VK327_02955, partial [Candidatus Paceibacterota bacterium]|nr:hypothetical protein [Candidatus Paceibacterota bacterium]
MKIRVLSFAAVLAITGILFGTAGCRTKPKSACCMADSATVATNLESVSSQIATPSQVIPDRPEKLTFPPLTYEPPAPQQYRVALKTGP